MQLFDYSPCQASHCMVFRLTGEETVFLIDSEQGGNWLGDTVQFHSYKNQGPSYSCVLTPTGMSNRGCPNLLLPLYSLVSSNKCCSKALVYVLSGHFLYITPCYSIIWIYWYYIFCWFAAWGYLLFGALKSNAAINIVYLP